MDSMKIVFFIDVDNTLLDNDHIKEEVKKSLITVLGKNEADHFWRHHNEFRERKKLVDFPNIIRGYCVEKHKDTCEITLGKIFNNIEFRHALYPKAFEALQHLKTLGKVVLFTEGDSVYQKRKIEQSGLGAMVDDVQLYEHKLEHLAKLLKKYSNYRVVFIDDRAESLKNIKDQFPNVFAIEACQGHYATTDHEEHEKLDMVVDSIAGLLSLTQNSLHNP